MTLYSDLLISPSVDGGRFVPGTLLSNRYRIVSLLGRGGMGEVYRAEDLKLKETVALKFLPEEVEKEADALARLESEVKIARKIAHPNVCRVFDLGEGAGLHFISMEFLPGDNLKHQLKRLGPPPLAKALQLGAQLCRALSAIHERDLLHRDVKPSNIMLDAEGVLRLMDFGLAASIGSGPTGGSLRYMAPELWKGGEPSVASDIYAAGLVLYELISGCAVFASESVQELGWMHAETPPVPLSQIATEVSSSHERLVLQCLEKDVRRRPRSAKDVLAGLQEEVSTRVWSQPGDSSRSPSAIPAAGDLADVDTVVGSPLPSPAEESPVAQAILICDLQDSFAITTELGESRAIELWRRHDNMARELLREFEGQEIDKSDGFLILFSRPWDAVRFALAYQDELRGLRAESSRDLKARLGIHYGELYLSRNPPAYVDRGAKPIEVEGTAKLIAARLMSLADGGRILLSRSAFDLARYAATDSERLPQGSGELNWLSHGAYLLQGFPEAFEVFEVARSDDQGLEAPLDTPKVRRLVQQPTVAGWRPAVDAEIPSRRHWRLQRKLGEGGFGDVWLAEREKTGERRVFKFCFDSVSLRSLQREITLFRLLKEELGERSDITRILDWSLEEAPYFLESEYTNAGNLEEWANEQGGISTVPLAVRLEIVIQISRALAAAHSVGVLHKDVKPANFLISRDGGKVRAQLSDFGIGTITERERLEQVGLTALGLTATRDESSGSGTRLYMAPEVLEGRRPRVQSDIYALGVVLYQVVVGDFRRSLAPGWRRDVQDEFLAEDIALAVDGKPETRLADAQELANRLQSLDQRKAEAREMAHREERARELADDLRRTRQRRRVWLYLSAVLGLLAISNGFLAYRISEESNRVKAEAQESIRLVTFLEDLFKVADPYGEGILKESRETHLSILTVLERGAERLDEFQNRPETQARLMNTLGGVYFALAEYDRAEGLLRKALALRKEHLGEDHYDVAQSLSVLGRLLSVKGDYDQAESLMGDALKIRRERFGRLHPDVASSLNELGNLHRENGNYTRSESLLREALEIRQDLFEEDHLEVAASINSLAGLFQVEGDFEAAERLYRQSLALRKKRLGPVHPDVAASLTDLAFVLEENGDFSAAEPLYEEALKIGKKIFGEVHPEVASIYNRLAVLYAERGDYQESKRLFEKVLSHYRLLGPDSLDVAGALGNLAHVLDREGDYKAAEPLAREALELKRKYLGDKHPRVAASMHVLALILGSGGDYEAAESLLRQSLELLHEIVGQEHLHVAITLGDLASVLRAKGDLEEAEPLARDGLSMAQVLVGREHLDAVSLQVTLARILIDKDDLDSAESLLRPALAIARRDLGDDHPLVADSLYGLALVRLGKGESESALPLAMEALEIRLRSTGRAHPKAIEAARTIESLERSGS